MTQATKALPARPNLEYLKKLAKERLRALRASNRAAKLADAQLEVAREHGFSSWRALKAQVDASIDPTDIAAFFKAIDNGDTKSVAKRVAGRPALAASRDSQGRSPLHAAAETNAADIVQLLLKSGSDPQMKFGDSAHTALSWALTTMAIDAATALVKGGVKPDLFCAAGMGALDAVKSFFDRGGNLVAHASRTGSSRYDENGKPLPRPPTEPREIVSDALYFACRNGRMEVVRFLLQQDPDLSFRAYGGATPLHWAHFGGSREIIQMLLDAGADPTARDRDYRCTPRAFGICVPVNWGIKELAIARLKQDPTLATINEGRGTPLHEAARGGHLDLAKLLLAMGADPSVKDIDGKTAAELARTSGHSEVLKLLGRSKQFKSAVAKKVKWMPIMDAAFKGDADRVRKLLDAGADPNVVSGTMHRHRPLLRAIELKKTAPRTEKHEQVVRLLLDRGADPKLRGTLVHLTALALAATGETRFIPLLRTRFEPLDIWHACVLAGEARVAALLKENPKLASATDINGWQPLHYCAASRLDEPKALGRIALMLLDAGADPMFASMFMNKWPLRPLYFACAQSNSAAVAEVLLKAGADPCDQETVYHTAVEEHDECLQLIERYVEKRKLAKECSWALNVQMKWGRTRGMKWFLAHGADPGWIDLETGRSAIDEAKKSRKSPSIIKLLMDYGRTKRAKQPARRG